MTGDDVDKFALTPWTPGPGGCPCSTPAPHRLVGQQVTLLDDGGDHACFVSEPVRPTAAGRFTPLRLHGAAAGLPPGHEVEGRTVRR